MESVREQLVEAIRTMCFAIDRPDVEGIALIISDDLACLGGRYLLPGDLPDDCEQYMRVFPVEWMRSSEEPFQAVNAALANPINRSTPYAEALTSLYSSADSAFGELQLRIRYGDDLFLSFCSVDPNPSIEAAERDFVHKHNNDNNYRIWLEEMA